MGAKPKLNLGLKAYEEMFMNDDGLSVAKLPKIYDIPIDLIDDFPDHPFKVRQDEDMELLVASIKDRGLITPVTLRPKRNGRYEMVSGNRRKEACRQPFYRRSLMLCYQLIPAHMLSDCSPITNQNQSATSHVLVLRGSFPRSCQIHVCNNDQKRNKASPSR